MSTSTLLLTPVLALALLAVAVQVARVIRGWVEARGSASAALVARERIRLEDYKERLLVTLGDLEFEHAMGRLGAEDYQEMKRRFERRAVEVLEQLEELA